MSGEDQATFSSLGDSLPELSPSGGEAAGPTAAPGLPDALRGIALTVQVVVGTARMTLSRIAALEAGAVIPLDQKLGAPVSILVNGREVAVGDLFVTEAATGQLGIRITGLAGIGRWP